MELAIQKYQLNKHKGELLGQLGDDYYQHIGKDHKLGDQPEQCALCQRFLKDEQAYHVLDESLATLSTTF